MWPHSRYWLRIAVQLAAARAGVGLGRTLTGATPAIFPQTRTTGDFEREPPTHLCQSERLSYGISISERLKRPPICRNHANAYGDTFSLPPEQRDEWEDRLCAVIGCVVGLAVRLRAAPGGRRPRCTAAAPDSGTGT